ncbi:MAG: hypothetical protein EPN20_11485, partial [Magnetospirillum sp.]
MSVIQVHIDGRLATITMANQPKRNALSEVMIEGILAGLEEARVRLGPQDDAAGLGGAGLLQPG